MLLGRHITRKSCRQWVIISYHHGPLPFLLTSCFMDQVSFTKQKHAIGQLPHPVFFYTFFPLEWRMSYLFSCISLCLIKTIRLYHPVLLWLLNKKYSFFHVLVYLHAYQHFYLCMCLRLKKTHWLKFLFFLVLPNSQNVFLSIPGRKRMCIRFS